jgi:predicted sulfurtransferase
MVLRALIFLARKCQVVRMGMIRNRLFSVIHLTPLSPLLHRPIRHTTRAAMAAAASEEEQIPYVNITGYKFVKLPDRDQLRIAFREKCNELNMKGLILLAPEGFNYFLAGNQQGCDGFRKYLDEEEPSGRFKDIFCKVSYSKMLPFKRMLVKLKNEIIALGDDNIDPEVESGLRLEPEEFKKWLDEGKECVIVDTRNDYEVSFDIM